MLNTKEGKNFRAADFHQDRLNPWLCQILNNPELAHAKERGKQLPREGLRLLDLHFATIYRRANTEIKQAALTGNEVVLAGVRNEYNRLIDYYQSTEDFKVLTRPQDLRLQNQPYSQEQIILHLEGGDIVTAPDIADELYARGVRSVGPIYSHDNLLGGGSSGDPNRGLTDLGKKVIDRLVELKMIIDTAHANHKTTADILERVRNYNKIVTTHTGLGSEKQRLITPELLKEIAKRGGVVGFTPANPFFPTFKNYIETYKQAGDITGSTEYSAIGTDFGGLDAQHLFEEFDEIGKLSVIAEQLSEIAGLTDDEIYGIMYGNVAKIVSRL